MTRDTFNPSAFVDELKKLCPRADYAYPPDAIALPSNLNGWRIYATPFFEETDTIPVAATKDGVYHDLAELDAAPVRDAAHYLELVTAAVKGQTIVPGLEVSP